MIKDKEVRFDDVNVSLKIRQTLLHWGYELVESDCFKLFLLNFLVVFEYIDRRTKN